MPNTNMTELIKEIVKDTYRETQITVYMQLKLLFEQANKLTFPYREFIDTDAEVLSVRKATAEEKLDFIAKGLEQLINVTKEVK